VNVIAILRAVEIALQAGIAVIAALRQEHAPRGIPAGPTPSPHASLSAAAASFRSAAAEMDAHAEALRAK
jgi:hypothetical protein